jgi:quercetin dioxygenase-like cupin family protein
MHTHPGEEIIYVIEGTLEYEIGGKVARVKAGDVLFVPAGTPHTAKNVGTATTFLSNGNSGACTPITTNP